MVGLSNLEDIHLVAILSHLQTNYYINLSNSYGGANKFTTETTEMTEYEKINLVYSKRLELIGTNGIQTDLVAVIKFSELCRRFYDIVHKSEYGKTLFTVMYHAEDSGRNINVPLEHIKCCSHKNCDNICHYINKYIDHTNPFHKLAVNSFNRIKSTHTGDLIDKYKYHLTYKQIESYYKNKKEST